MPTEAEREYFHDYYLKHSGASRQRIVPGAERESKTCTKCGEIKPRSEFTVREAGPRKGHLASYCKKCCVTMQQERKARDPTIYRRTEWPSKLKRYYGITVADYERMLLEQGGGCALCGTKDPTHGNRTYKRIKRIAFDVDHDHKTGKVRGLLCTRCNRLVGLAGDSLSTALKLVRYLRKEV